MRFYPAFFSAGFSATAIAAAAALCLTAALRLPTAKPLTGANVIERPELAFEANRGQTDPNVKYLSRGPGYTMLLTGKEAVVRLSGRQAGAAKQATVKMTLVGAKPAPKVLSRS